MKKIIGIVLALVFALGLASPVTAQVDPALVHQEMAPADSITVTKTVTTPVIPPLPDIYFLADTTGSMGSAIANVQTNAAAILAAIAAVQPDAQFGVGDYKDFPPSVSNPYAFVAGQAITANITDVQNAINAWLTFPGAGSDGPEGQFYALTEIATDPVIGWRTSSSKIVVWFGDAPGHDPVPDAATGLGYDITEATVTDALVAADITVIAISLTSGDYPAAGLDDDPNSLGGDYNAAYGIAEDGSSGQATRIVSATGGVLLATSDPDEVADIILAGLTTLKTDVWPTIVADPGLTVTFEPSVIHDVVSGSAVTFTETVAIDPGAPYGVFHATVTFWANNYPEEGTPIGVQEIEVGDFTRPLVGSVETVNPAGKKIPPAGSTTLPGPKGGMNEDGFYLLSAADNYDPNPMIWVSYVGSSDPMLLGPFASGTVVKFTEDPTSAPVMQKMGSSSGQAGAVDWHIILPADAVVRAVDYAGNWSDPDVQLVPPLPK